MHRAHTHTHTHTHTCFVALSLSFFQNLFRLLRSTVRRSVGSIMVPVVCDALALHPLIHAIHTMNQ